MSNCWLEQIDDCVWKASILKEAAKHGPLHLAKIKFLMENPVGLMVRVPDDADSK